MSHLFVIVTNKTVPESACQWNGS